MVPFFQAGLWHASRDVQSCCLEQSRRQLLRGQALPAAQVLGGVPVQPAHSDGDRPGLAACSLKIHAAVLIRGLLAHRHSSHSAGQDRSSGHQGAFHWSSWRPRASKSSPAQRCRRHVVSRGPSVARPGHFSRITSPAFAVASWNTALAMSALKLAGGWGRVAAPSLGRRAPQRCPLGHRPCRHRLCSLASSAPPLLKQQPPPPHQPPLIIRGAVRQLFFTRGSGPV